MRSSIRTTVVLCLVAILSLMGASDTPDGDTSAAPVVPAGGALPTRLYDVDRDLDGTDEVGLIGPLAAAWTVNRGRMIGGIPLLRPYYERGVVGVSAKTGTYAMLDIPMEQGTYRCGFVELSPDGRRLAFWITRVSRPWVPWTCDEASALGVYDTVTGEVRRRPLRAPGQSVAWIDSHRLVRGPFKALRPSAEELRTTPFEVWDVRRPEAVHRDGLPRSLQDVRLPRRRSGGVVVDGTSTWAVRVLEDLDGGPLLVSSWEDGLGPESRRVPGAEDYVAVVGWREDEAVAMAQSADDGPGRLVAVDVHTGRRQVLTRVEGAPSSNPVSVATDLLSVPPVPRPAPSSSGWLHGSYASAALSLFAILLLGTALLAVTARRARAARTHERAEASRTSAETAEPCPVERRE